MTFKAIITSNIPMNEGDETGFNGDCGNWAIAYQRKHGGKLYFLPENDYKTIAHVFVFVKGKWSYTGWRGRIITCDECYIDAKGKWSKDNFFDHYCEAWDLDQVEYTFPITEEQIFNDLIKTNEKRITELMSIV